MGESEGDFKPLFVPVIQEKEEKKEKKNEEENLKVKLEEIRRENLSLKEKIIKLNEERIKLEKELENLKELLREKEREKEKLSVQLEEVKTEKEDIKELCKRVNFQLEEVLGELKIKFEEFILKVLEEFSLSLPQTEVIKKDLERIFSELLNYKLPVKLYMNPKDYQELESYILSFKEKLKSEGLEVQVITDDEISPGEVRIKSEQFYIERSPKDFAKAVFEEVLRDVFKGY